MTPAVTALFKSIEDQILAMEPYDRRDVINLLSVLRGPDAERCEALKAATTAHFRKGLFPRLAYSDPRRTEMNCTGIEGIPWCSELTAEPPQIENAEGDHFRDHINYAIQAFERK